MFRYLIMNGMKWRKKKDEMKQNKITIPLFRYSMMKRRKAFFLLFVYLTKL